MKVSIMFLLQLLCLCNLHASIEKLIEDYSDIAIAYVSAEKEIDALIIISGNGFNIDDLKNESLGHAITHRAIANKPQVSLLLKTPKRKDIPWRRVIWWRTDTVTINGYGVFHLNEFLNYNLQIKPESKNESE